MPTVFIISACGMLSSDKNAETVEENTEAEEEPLAPYGYLIEDEEFVKAFKGFYIYRNDQFYSLNRVVSYKDIEEYNIGEKLNNGLDFHWVGESEYYGQTITECSLGLMNINNEEERVYYFNTIGDYDIIKLEPDDEIRSYGVSNVEITKLESLEYGFRREMGNRAGLGVYSTDEWDKGLASGWLQTTERKKHIPQRYKELKYQIGDEEINYNYNLEKDTEVTVSWYEKTDYYEYTAVADSKFFYATSYDFNGVLGDSNSGPIKKEGTLCKDGYATYDFSDLEPGVYFLRSTEIVSKDFGETMFNGYGFFIVE